MNWFAKWENRILKISLCTTYFFNRHTKQHFMICKSPDNFLFFCCEFCFFESPLRFEVKHNCGRRKKIRQHLGSNIGGFPLFALFVFCLEFCFLKSPLGFEVKHNYGCRKKIRQHLGITISFSLFALLVFLLQIRISQITIRV